MIKNKKEIFEQNQEELKEFENCLNSNKTLKKEFSKLEKTWNEKQKDYEDQITSLNNLIDKYNLEVFLKIFNN